MNCPACNRVGGRPGSTLHSDIPALTQYQTPELVGAIVYESRDPADDPNWWRSGATDRSEYRRWCRHCCGMTCLQMVLHHRDGHAPPMLDLARGCTRHGGYTVDEAGEIHGLVYAPFASYAREEHGLEAHVRQRLGLDDLRDELDAGQLVIVSVHKEIRRPHCRPSGQGGHLVLAIGHDAGGIHLRNPSGHTGQARAAHLPWPVFGAFFAGRGITLTW